MAADGGGDCNPISPRSESLKARFGSPCIALGLGRDRLALRLLSKHQSCRNSFRSSVRTPSRDPPVARSPRDPAFFSADFLYLGPRWCGAYRLRPALSRLRPRAWVRIPATSVVWSSMPDHHSDRRSALTRSPARSSASGRDSCLVGSSRRFRRRAAQYSSRFRPSGRRAASAGVRRCWAAAT